MGRPEPLSTGFSYPVEGKLKSLAKGHEIWVLSQDESSGAYMAAGLFSGAIRPDARDMEWKNKWQGKCSGAYHRRYCSPNFAGFLSVLPEGREVAELSVRAAASHAS
jgi:hypothetical protein